MRISDFRIGQPIVHMAFGAGRVVSRTNENLGVRFNNGCVAAYGSSWFDAFPNAIGPGEVLDEELREAERSISIEDRVHLDITGHLPEDF